MRYINPRFTYLLTYLLTDVSINPNRQLFTADLYIRLYSSVNDCEKRKKRKSKETITTIYGVKTLYAPSGGSRKKIFGGLAPRHLGGNNG